SGTATPNGLAVVPFPVKVGLCKIDDPPLASIVPATVSFDVGESVPMPTLPNLSSKMVVSPMNELLLVNPVHFVNRPSVPPPRTGRLGPAPIGIRFVFERAPPLARMFVEDTAPRLIGASSNLNRGFNTEAFVVSLGVSRV